MGSNLIYSDSKFVEGYTKFGILVLLSLLLPAQETQAITLNPVALVFNTSLKITGFTVKLILKSLLSRPRLLATILAICFHREIFEFTKDVSGVMVGEFPITSFALCACTLWYISRYFEPDDRESQDQAQQSSP
jgi:hypothetical protein